MPRIQTRWLPLSAVRCGARAALRPSEWSASYRAAVHRARCASAEDGSMPRELRLAYFAHSPSALTGITATRIFFADSCAAWLSLGCLVSIFEPAQGWSIDHLRDEPQGEHSIRSFHAVYPDLSVIAFDNHADADPDFLRGEPAAMLTWSSCMNGTRPQLAAIAAELREKLGFRLLFHDTHHRASSSPDQIRAFGTDGLMACSHSAKRSASHLPRAIRHGTRMDAARSRRCRLCFGPLPASEKSTDVVWIGNWGDDERTAEIREFFL